VFGDVDPAVVDHEESAALNTPPPWITHRLYLHCAIDTDLLTAEGTEKIRSRKQLETQRMLNHVRKKVQALIAECSSAELTEPKRQKLEQHKSG
jgi:hypothetical protein